ncbi:MULTISPECIES: MliC family protein [unclassified Desulfovibrio]|uniref:MliC family protein n=1 Tax=unclassified Desulfovibrio TaxID=2593640 RepID=UPI002FDA9D8B
MRYVFILILVVIIAVGLHFAFQKYCGGIYVEKNHSETYSCPGGKSVSVQFFSTSDRKLMFAKVVMPDGVEYSLPLMPSASGSRYSDEFALEAWFKGNELTLSKPSENGTMEPVYECTAK